MRNDPWTKLQIFAGEGAPAGEGGAEASGESAADAGQQRLLELGVPRDKLPKGKVKTVGRPAPAQGTTGDKPPAAGTSSGASATFPVRGEGKGAPAAEKGAGAGAKNAAETTEALKPAEKSGQQPGDSAGDKPAALDWEAIVKHPDFNNRMQYMMRQRLGEEARAKETLAALTPVLQQIAKEKGIKDLDLSDPSKLDPQNLALRLSHDRDYVRQVAAELGVDEDTAAEVVQNKDALAYYQKRERDRQLRDAFNQHLSGLRTEAEALKAEIPELDLDKEMMNPVFRRLVGPETKLGVKRAYWALHADELMQRKTTEAAKQSRERLAAAVQANQQRPRENGTGGQAAQAPVPGFDYRSMSPAEREAFKKRIYEAAYRGEKIYPGRE